MAKTDGGKERGVEMFSEKQQRSGEQSRLPWVIASVAVALVLASLLFMSRLTPAMARGPLPPAPYGTYLTFSSLVMSESTSLSGGKSTFLDGRVRNTGSGTVTATTLQVQFSTGEGLPPQTETVPLTLIRTREPYVDTQPLSASPLEPGAEREFRLIFESIGSNWDQQVPALRVVAVTLR